MAFAIFFGGISLGFILGFTIMALLAFSGDSFQREEAQAIGSDLTCAYPPTRKFSSVREDRLQAAGACFTPGP